MNIRVIADSSSNIFRFDGLDYRTVPLKIIFNGLEYPDVESLNAPALMRRIHESGGSTSTSCPSIGDWMDAMEGADRILCMTISGQLSGAYNAALNAAVEYMDEHPGVQVHVVDSLSTGPEIRLGLEHLKQDIEKGIPFDELPTRLHRYFSEIHILFSLESLTNLSRGGRVSSAVAKIAGMIGLQFVGAGSPEGTIQMVGKCRGTNRTRKLLLDTMSETGFDGGRVRISHCDNPTGAAALADAIRKVFRNCDVSIDACAGICSYYADLGGLIVAYETNTL